MASTLVIILAETRSCSSTFALFEKNLLNVFQADLALCVADNEREDKGNRFYQKAKYIWQSKEYEDWGEGLEYLIENHHPDWRKLLQIPKQWLGGIRGEHEHPGSGGILLYFREFLRKSLLESGALDKYERFIVTRSDFMYQTPHVPPGLLDNQYIWIPNGEQYGGYTDRHILCPGAKILQTLSVANILTRDPELVIGEMQHKQRWNLEKYLKFHMQKSGLENCIRMFPYTMYAVREPGGHTRWSEGSFDPSLNVFIKYRSEHSRARLARLIVGKNGWSQFRINAFDFLYGQALMLASALHYLAQKFGNKPTG
ncbi:MAG: hypothetical protein EXR85_05910 [Xanthomonadales bacterium]|nr:hypothetical protein [Xanthomonadales bacterium]